MQAKKLLEMIASDFYTGIPNLKLKPLCDYLMKTYGIDPKHHIIAANEGDCVAIAAGYHLATGKIPVVYLQNSGEGNIINPVLQLLSDKEYSLPVIFIIGWRGEPGLRDEPQYIRQGEITVKLLVDMGIIPFILDKETTEDELEKLMYEFNVQLSNGKDVAFIVREGAITYEEEIEYKNNNSMIREEVLRHIVAVSGENPVIAATGKTCCELYEIRENTENSHKYDFLNIGSAGHCSSIAMGIALNKPDIKVWCLDGDGAMLMNMGAMAVIGANKPANLVHIILNNSSYETAGGIPTIAGAIDVIGIARACGYPGAVCVKSYEELDNALNCAKKSSELYLIEVMCSIGGGSDLGCPDTDILENKISFMQHLESLIRRT